MNDFIFGTLATEELRRARVQLLRGGVTHRVRRTPRDPRPGQSVLIELTAGPAHPGERAWVYWTTDGSDPAGNHGQPLAGFRTFSMPLEPSGVEWDNVLWGYIRAFRGNLPGQPAGTIVRYRLSLEEMGTGEVYADGGMYNAYCVDEDMVPAWARDAVIYQVFVDRFDPGVGRNWKKPRKLSGFFGGRIEGITKKLDYITEVGANTLWLSPIFPSPSHHGYDATDLFEIEPRLGTKADLKLLLDESHRRGLRVLLDFVPNHWSDLHPTFQDAIKNPASQYRNWYIFNHWPDKYESFFGVHSLPQVNLRDPGARQYMLDAARYWLEFGVDGYRLDYAIGPTLDFWADFRRVTRSVRQDCWTFGEIVDPPDVQLSYEGLLDGALDFMLLEAFRQTFAFGSWDGIRFAGFLDRHEAAFPDNFSRPSFLDNHDMNRFLWVAHGDKRRLKLAALCQFTLRGAPIIYYGTEAGLSQQRDIRQDMLGIPEEARLPMVWGSHVDRDLISFYRDLIEFRKRNPISQGKRSTIAAETDWLAYRQDNEGQSFTVVLNLNSSSEKVLPFDGGELQLASDQNCCISRNKHRFSLTLPPLSGAILV
ncbi:MAG TPA: alpha-amylase family glycosyl hydrolase [Anaerolineaceae bacterium]|nr:alpha-amylase family glycosyl hydrolase [Anaerolineaceae bacterium]